MIRLLAAALEPLRPLARRLPESLKRPLRTLSRAVLGRVATPYGSAGYAARVANENTIFADQETIDNLPPITHYWGGKWLQPQLAEFGFSNPEEFFAEYIARTIAESGATRDRPARIASLGAGNCDNEVRIAGLLVERGVREFVIECVDINQTMLSRGRTLAADAGLDEHIVTMTGDFNAWRPEGLFDAVIGNQSLHHVMQLEDLFDTVLRVLKPRGRFLASDIIGRNGHQRWPEAMAIIQEYWRELPKSYRWNVQLNRQNRKLRDWDCSIGSFEGIRAQDILPLLMERFGFEFFLGYGNLIDPFIDRGFGPHFDPEKEWDRGFIDRVHQRDDAEIQTGTIKPTHMLAAMRVKPWQGECVHRANLTPEFCVRRTN